MASGTIPRQGVVVFIICLMRFCWEIVCLVLHLETFFVRKEDVGRWGEEADAGLLDFSSSRDSPLADSQMPRDAVSTYLMTIGHKYEKRHPQGPRNALGLGLDQLDCRCL